MANTNAPFGFIPVKSQTGGAHTAANYYIISSTSARIGKGDLVALTNAGLVARETSATAVGPWVGVSLSDSGATRSVGQQIPVCDDPQAIFEVQSSTGALAQTDFNTTVKVNCSAATDTNFGTSKNVLIATAATASNGVRLLRLATRADNVLGASAVVEVKINANNSANNTASV